MKTTKILSILVGISGLSLVLIFILSSMNASEGLFRPLWIVLFATLIPAFIIYAYRSKK